MHISGGFISILGRSDISFTAEEICNLMQDVRTEIKVKPRNRILLSRPANIDLLPVIRNTLKFSYSIYVLASKNIG